MFSTQCVYVKNEKIHQHFEGFFLRFLSIWQQQKLPPNLKLSLAIFCLCEFIQIARTVGDYKGEDIGGGMQPLSFKKSLG